MSACGVRSYRTKCCGRTVYVDPGNTPCIECAIVRTPIDDPLAIEYRERVAARAAQEASA